MTWHFSTVKIMKYIEYVNTTAYIYNGHCIISFMRFTTTTISFCFFCSFFHSQFLFSANAMSIYSHPVLWFDSHFQLIATHRENINAFDFLFTISLIKVRKTNNNNQNLCNAIVNCYMPCQFTIYAYMWMYVMNVIFIYLLFSIFFFFLFTFSNKFFVVHSY